MVKQVRLRELKQGDKFKLVNTDSAPFWFFSHVVKPGKICIIRFDNTFEIYSDGSKLVYIY